MDAYEQVRRKVLIEGLSQRQVARETGYARNTIKKILIEESPPGYRRKAPASLPTIGAFQGIIDQWLNDDKEVPRKQQHTSKRIYIRLKEEHQYQGSYSAVCRYVKCCKDNENHREVFVPRAFAPGSEAQVDFGKAEVCINGQAQKVCLFCMRFAYSKKSFVCAFRTEDQVAFLEGHVRAFAFFGGVPQNLTYDNLTDAVRAVGKGQDRRLTKRFLELRNHYLFTSRFCNRGAGHEKGDVENLVKHAQRNFMTPVPSVVSFDALEASLQQCCDQDGMRCSGRSKVSIDTLFKDEQPKLLPLPSRPFEACVNVSTFGSKQLTVEAKSNRYSIPYTYAFKSVQIKIFVERIEIYHKEVLIAKHPRSYKENDCTLNAFHYLPVLARKPGVLKHGIPFNNGSWGSIFQRYREALLARYGEEGDTKFIEVLLLSQAHDLKSVEQAVEASMRTGVYSPSAIDSRLSYQAPEKHKPLALPPHLEDVTHQPPPSLAQYDNLAATGKEVVA